MPNPVVVGTWSFAHRPCADAWAKLDAGGSSLDAVESVCVAVEDDPDVDSVGYGGLADRSGAVTLDGCIMRSPRECGCVCAVRRHRHPVSIARLVMERSPHVMLAGAGADAFAETHGMEPEDPCAEPVRTKWQQWMAAPREIDQSRDAGTSMRPIDSGGGGRLFPDLHGPESGHDTIGVLALDRSGTLAGACSTSGTPYKVPGRVGDAPTIGHGLYVAPGVGAATATGTGELVMGLCSTFHAVELMREGLGTLEALERVMMRIGDSYDLREQDQVAIIALRPDGTHAAVALREGFRWVVVDDDGARVMEPGCVVL